MNAAPARRPARAWLAWGIVIAAAAGGGVVAAGCDAGGGPHIDSVAPRAGRAGDAITLSGRGFCADVGAAADCGQATAGYVAFGINPPMVRAAVTRWDDTAIVVTVPESVARGGTELIVTVDGLSSNAADFEVQ